MYHPSPSSTGDIQPPKPTANPNRNSASNEIYPGESSTTTLPVSQFNFQDPKGLPGFWNIPLSQLSHDPKDLPGLWNVPISQLNQDLPGFWSTGNSTAVSLSGVQLTDDNKIRPTLSRHFSATIDTKHTDLLLIVCGFVSGLVDGVSFSAWGSFSSMQTGNTLFLALGASGQPAYPAYLWAKSLIALTIFLASNLLFIRAHRALTPRRRSTLVLSFTLQTTALLATAILIQLGAVSPKPEDPRAPIEWTQVIPISLLAFQAGGQIVASRVLAFDEIPTVVLTALFCDLLVDPRLLASVNPKRNRRVAAFLSLFFGAMTAGGLSRVTGIEASLWFAMGLKLGVTLAWVVWKGEARTKGEVEV